MPLETNEHMEIVQVKRTYGKLILERGQTNNDL